MLDPFESAMWGITFIPLFSAYYIWLSTRFVYRFGLWLASKLF